MVKSNHKKISSIIKHHKKSNILKDPLKYNGRKNFIAVKVKEELSCQ